MTFQSVRSRRAVSPSRVGVLRSETGAGGSPVLNETMKGCSVMRSIKSVLVALVAVLALGAVAASGASAHEFRVEGKGLTGEEAFTGAGGVFHLVVKISGAEIKLECKQTSSAGAIKGAGSLSAQVALKECKLTKPSFCKLPASQELELPLTPDTGLLVGTEALEGIEFKEAGLSEEVLRLTMENSGGVCGLLGSYMVSGHWACELHEAGVEATEHEQVCRKEASHLWIGSESNKGTLEYTEKVKLTLGKKWSAV